MNAVRPMGLNIIQSLNDYLISKKLISSYRDVLFQTKIPKIFCFSHIVLQVTEQFEGLDYRNIICNVFF